MMSTHAPHSLVRIDIVRERSPYGGLPAPETPAATFGAIGTGSGVGEVAGTAGKLLLNWRRLAIAIYIEEKGIARERSSVEGCSGHW
jgi:hypothetical protein